jgi:hypothetical protein
MDQDELRRRAEQVMRRRIDTTAQQQPQAPARRPAASGGRKTLAERLQELERRLAEAQQYGPPVEQFPAQPPPESVAPEEIPDPEAYETGRERFPRDESQRPQEPEPLFELRPRRERPAPAPPQPVRRESYRAAIRRSLDDPAAFRRAFVLAEVLGPPVALRDENESDL